MLKKIQIAVWAALICVGMARAEDTLIYFRIVDGFKIVNFDGTETTWDSSYRSAEGYAIDSARLVVTGGNLTEETPLILGYISGDTVVSSGGGRNRPGRVAAPADDVCVRHRLCERRIQFCD